MVVFQIAIYFRAHYNIIEMGIILVDMLVEIAFDTLCLALLICVDIF